MWNKVSVAYFKALFHICLEEIMKPRQELCEPPFGLGIAPVFVRNKNHLMWTSRMLVFDDRKRRKGSSETPLSTETYLRYEFVGTNAFLLATRPGVGILWQ
jgi:hypothetical protein